MTPDAILDFWFAHEPHWFAANPAFDDQVRRFESWIQPAYGGELGAWEGEPRSRLALILILDQFPRNLYRRKPRSFAYDDQARRLTHQGLQAGHDLALGLHERAFFYLPLEHSELPEDQKLSLECYRRLVVDHPHPKAQLYLDYAQRHADIIARFGRYPHRNAILGRESTPEEEAFLKTPGSSFL